jgi:4-alpha-glucanotransferase
MLPLFSIRTDADWGIGEITDLPRLARWASQAGFSAVQLLPFHEVALGETSPYAAVSAFALDPIYLSLDQMEDFQAAGGVARLTEDDRITLARCRAGISVAWKDVRAIKERACKQAFLHFCATSWETKDARAQSLNAFVHARSPWLDDFALYWVLEKNHGSNWQAWPEPLRHREPAALAESRTRFARDILLRQYLEWNLDSQWSAARRESAALGVELGGDLPFVVSRDAADVWSRPADFHLDLRLGAPPDPFSSEGQDWGLPVFDWDAMRAGGWAWMRARAARAAALASFWRVDHVVGLYRSYFRTFDGRPPGFLPPDEPDQLRQGEDALGVLASAGAIIAEDLGVVPNFVRASLDRLAIPGFRVLCWEKDGDVFRDPARWPEVSVATTGTHDTPAMATWYDGLGADERRALARLPALHHLEPHQPFGPVVHEALLGAVYGASSRLCILPFSDALGSRDRINVPGTVTDVNWTYRMPMTVNALQSDSALTTRLRAHAARSGRLLGG